MNSDVVVFKIGESEKIKLSNGDVAEVKLLALEEITDDLRLAVRSAKVKVSVNGQEVTLNTGNYNLPVSVTNVQIDCPITKGYYKNTGSDAWGLEKDVRLRLWPAGSPFITPGTFVYPIRQRIFANDTQMSNEPCYVDWGENPAGKTIYYHNGLDFGGSEGLDEVLSAVDGVVVTSGNDTLPEYDGVMGRPVYSSVRIRDDRGWYYSFAHLVAIEPEIKPGARVKMGQKIGTLGKEGGSGGWTHLHFAIKSVQPSGKWGTEEGFAYIWEAFLNQYKPEVIALARPHHLVFTGQAVTLDAKKSKSYAGEITSYEWTFSDGTTASGPVQERKYILPGTYSEILKVVDSKGNIDYDFAVVQVRNKKDPGKMPPSIHANYYPSLNIKPGDPLTFKVRTFRTDTGNEVWDFGDGTSVVKTKSKVERSDPLKHKYAETVHKYEKPGHYIVTVGRSNELGYKATAHLHIEVIP